ncbi:MAG: GNAT family N-acetyltransferase [Legionellaceae bacterium]|nr:GNAT family N-acetyltransferase [Legionellaceae bacterium]
MRNVKIEFTQQLADVTRQKMSAGLLAYEKSRGINVDYQPFALELFDADGDVIGVLEAFSSYSCVHIQDLWIDEAHRGKGYGRQLISVLEKYAASKSSHNINTVSCDFQAPDFYKKCGFEVEFVRKNLHNPKLNMTFFIKLVESVTS